MLHHGGGHCQCKILFGVPLGIHACSFHGRQAGRATFSDSAVRVCLPWCLVDCLFVWFACGTSCCPWDEAICLQ